MRNRSYLFILILIALFSSCDEQNNYIIETDLKFLMPDTINGETEAQRKKINIIFKEKLKSNTINKRIPNMFVNNLSGQRFNLQNIISRKTILIASDCYCGFGQESLTNDFPIALDSLKNEIQDYDIICLIKRTDLDFENTSNIDDFTKNLQEIYESIYIIEESDAYKMNLLGNPVRFYINEDQEVKHIGTGLSNVENQIKEIRKYTGVKTR